MSHLEPSSGYGSVSDADGAPEPAHLAPIDIPAATVTALVIMCDMDDATHASDERSLLIQITQFLRLSDGSLIRLDMDRGLSRRRHGPTEPISWKRPAREVVAEVVNLVQSDALEPNAFPWDLYAEAAKRRGIHTSAAELSGIPWSVFLSGQLAEAYEM